MTSISRRNLLFAGAGAASAAALSACSPTAGQAPKGGGSAAASSSSSAISDADRQKALNTPTNLTFWTWVPNIKDEVALFMKAYPKITVDVQNVGQGAAHYQKMRTALKAGKGAPDVSQVEFQYINSFTLTKDLLDLTPYGAASLQSKFVPWTWSQVASNGGIWSVPQDSGPMGNLFRTDIMSSAGITNGAATWDEYMTQAETVRSKTSSYISNFAPTQAGVMIGLLWQAGSKPFGYDGKQTVKINLTDANANKIATYWQNMIKKDLVSTDPDFNDAWYQGLAKGKYAGWLTAAWGPVFLQGTVAKTSGKWHAAKLPQWSAGDDVTGNWGGSTNAVLKPTQNPIAAYELATWINTNLQSTLMFANKQSLFPTTKDTLSDSSFVDAKSSFFGGQQVNKLFSQISTTVDPQFPWLPFMDYAYSSYNDTVGKAITGKGDLVSGMAAWEKALTTYAKSQGFTVTQ